MDLLVDLLVLDNLIFFLSKRPSPFSQGDPCRLGLIDWLEYRLHPSKWQKLIEKYIETVAKAGTKLELSTRFWTAWKQPYHAKIYNLTRWHGRHADDRFDICPGDGDTLTEAYEQLWENVLEFEHVSCEDALWIKLAMT